MGDKSKPWTQKYLNGHAGIRFELAQATSAPPFNRRPFMRSLTLLPWNTGAISSQDALLDWLKLHTGKTSTTSLGPDSATSAVNSSTLSSALIKEAPITLQPEPQRWTVCDIFLSG